MGAAASLARQRQRVVVIPRRFYRTWSRPSQGLPPIHQLTFHNDVAVERATWVAPRLFFKYRSLVYTVPVDELIKEGEDGTVLLSGFAKWFLDTSIHLIQSNHKLGYSIAPSFTEDNIAMWLVNGSCALKSLRWYYLGEKVDGKVITTADSYSALVHYFVGLLKQVEGPDVMHRLSPIVTDLFAKMTLDRVRADQNLRKWHDVIIRNHPAFMSTEGCLYLIREADMLLKKVLLNGSEAERAIAREILAHLPYLWSVGPASDPCPEADWVSIALGHEALKHWYEFYQSQSQKTGGADESSRGETSQSNERQKAADMYRARNIKKSLDFAQARHNLSLSGGRFVSLWRNGISHYLEAQLKDKLLTALGSDRMKTVWPIKKKVVLSIFIINYPDYLPAILESFAHEDLWRRLKIHNCWARDSRSFGHTPVRIAGFKAIIIKLGLRHTRYQGTFNIDDGESEDDEDRDHLDADTTTSTCLIETWD